jgi:hypothetical protein
MAANSVLVKLGPGSQELGLFCCVAMRSGNSLSFCLKKPPISAMFRGRNQVELGRQSGPARDVLVQLLIHLRTIIVETANRFAGDLMVHEVEHARAAGAMAHLTSSSTSLPVMAKCD